MNYDRLLTRVWDKEEKKMLYLGGKFWFKTKESIFNACDNECIYAVRANVSTDHSEYGQLSTITFANRFIPMQCSGFREDCGYENVEDGMPAFEFDFIKTHAGVCLLILLRDGCWIAESLDKKYSVDLASLQGKFSIRSNKFENLEFLEEIS